MLPSEVLEGLFDEKKVRILKVFFSSPDEEFYLREIAREAEVSPATTYRVLNTMVDLDLVKVSKAKKTKYYKLAKDDNTKALKGLFEEKQPDPLEELVSAVSGLEGVDKIILHGEATEEKINILIIGGRVDHARVTEECARVEDEFSINVVEVTLTPQQFKQMAEMGSFPRKKKQVWP